MRSRRFFWGMATVIVIAAVLTLLVMIRLESDKGKESKSIAVTEKIQQRLISVPVLCQHPQLPTGCESVAAVMVLNFYGENVESAEFAETWIEKNSDFYTYDGQDFGPDPNKAFAGDPFTAYGYGCYSPVIVEAVNRNSRKCKAQAVQGKSLEYICREYIDKGVPVLVWATIDMTRSKAGESWVLPDGSFFTWISGEHCLVLVGYDESNYYFNDPDKGKTVGFEKSLTNLRFREMGSQAVVITEKN